MQTKWENTATRACKDTESFRKNSWVWFWGVEVIGSGALAGLTGGFLWNRSTLSGRIVGFITFGVFVGGIFLIYGLVILWNLFLASYRQRNELRAKVEQYEQEQNHPKSKYYDQIAKETTNKHWEYLAILAQELASKMELPFSIDQRYLNLKFDKNDDGIHALMFIDYCNSFDYEISDDYVKSDADWGLYSYLQTHLLAEDNSWMENMSKLRDNVEILHNKLHDVSLTATNITTEWSVIIHGDWNEDYSVEAGDLSSKVREAIEPMQKDVISACNKCYEVIKPMRITLGHLVKRKTFKGECPACP